MRLPPFPARLGEQVSPVRVPQALNSLQCFLVYESQVITKREILMAWLGVPEVKKETPKTRQSNLIENK